MTFESEGLLIVAIYIWLPPGSYVVFSDNSGQNTQLQDKQRKTPMVLGVNSVKVKVIVTCAPCGALIDCVSFV